jgi:zinc protease
MSARTTVPIMRIRVFASAWLLLAAAVCLAQERVPMQGASQVASVEGIDEYRLKNGLQVLLIPDDSKPTTTVNLTYRVGSRHENYGETGMAHLLEHLLFKGSPRHPQVWNEFVRRGLRANGSTWYDRTNYTATFAFNEDNLRWYLGWLADSMVNSFIARKDLDTEMTVVRNEMESGENSPFRVLFSKTLATMYEWHNYGKSTIGARSDVENVDIARLQAFYRRFYQPDNATLIVSGKFAQARVLGWVVDSFGSIKPPGQKRPAQYTLDPVQDGERSVSLRRVGGVPMMIAAYHVPPGAHPDFAAVELLALVMGDAPSGRLHRRLTEKGLAAETFAFAQGLAEPGFAMFGAQLAPGQETEAARAEMLATLESVAREPITAEELARARTKWLKDWEQGFSNPERVGVALSESISQGDWRLYFLMRDRIRDIELADVQRVAEQRLLPSNRTLGTYLPTDSPRRAPAPSRVDVAQTLQDFKPQAAAAKVESFDATPANIDARTRLSKVGGVNVALLTKGARGGVVQTVLTLHFGDVATLSGQEEVADALASLLDKGTTTLTRQQVQDRLDQLKTELRFSSAAGRVTVSLTTRRQHLADALLLVGDLLRSPALTPEALDEYKRQALSGIEQQRKEPGSIAANALARLGDPYPRGDPRHARSFDEMAEDVQALSADRLRAFHNRFYGVTQAEFSAVGDFDEAQVRDALAQALGDWPGKEPYQRVPDPLVQRPAKRLVLTTPDKQNATLMVRLSLPLSDRHPDYPALTMANHLLGSGGSSRLWQRIRERDGLSYDVHSFISWSQRDDNSTWQGGAIFAPQNRGKVEAAFTEELSRALERGFTETELADGKRGLLNFRRLSRAQDRTLAFALASNLELGRTFAVSAQVDAALSNLTLAEVNAALRKYIRPEQFTWAFAGDFTP